MIDLSILLYGGWVITGYDWLGKLVLVSNLYISYEFSLLLEWFYYET